MPDDRDHPIGFKVRHFFNNKDNHMKRLISVLFTLLLSTPVFAGDCIGCEAELNYTSSIEGIQAGEGRWIKIENYGYKGDDIFQDNKIIFCMTRHDELEMSVSTDKQNNTYPSYKVYYSICQYGGRNSDEELGIDCRQIDEKEVFLYENKKGEIEMNLKHYSLNLAPYADSYAACVPDREEDISHRLNIMTSIKKHHL